MLKSLQTAFILFMLLTLLTGLIYPLVITGIAQVFFPYQANGRLIEYQGQLIGSEWIGQSFTDLHYFWGRPSATTPYPYNAAFSSASNLGPSNPDFLASVKNRLAQWHQVDPANQTFIPVDLVTASGSGLDPDISPAAALYQAPRVAKSRHLPLQEVEELIYQYIQPRTAKILGEKRVNVLRLNLALDKGFPLKKENPDVRAKT